MPHPAIREAASPVSSADETAENERAFSTEDLNGDWRDDIAEFPIAFAGIGDDPAASGAEAAELEATMMDDLEAVATAFWMELGPDLSSPDLAAGLAGQDWESPADSRDERAGGRIEPVFSGFVGPEPHGALIDFRPPRARRRRSDRSAHAEAEIRAVREDIEPPGGAFADDLAARNKEFYDLLKNAGGSARKITIPASDPRAGQISPGAETNLAKAAASAPEATRTGRRKGDLRRQALAMVILAVVIGVCGAIIAIQSSTTREASPTLAAAAPATAVSPPSGDGSNAATAIDGAPSPNDLVSRETLPADPTATASIVPVDPGTLATPPLYESDEVTKPAPVPATSDTAVGLAAIPLRTDTTGAGLNRDLPPASGNNEAVVPEAGAERIIPPAVNSSHDTLPVAEDPVPAEAGAAPAEAVEPKPEPAKTKAEKAKAKPAQVAAAEPAHTEQAAGNSKLLRISAGPATVTVSVNMRAGPDNGARVVRVLRAGTRVDVVSCKFWCEVIAGGDRGWVYQRYIGRGSDAAQAPAAAGPEVKDQADPERKPLDLLWFIRPNG